MKKLFQSLKYLNIYDILSIFIFLIILIPSQIYKLYLKITRQRVWLITEDGHTARDNGYHFFKYIRSEHKNDRAYYVIDRKSYDYEKVRELGNIIQFRSLKHWIYYLASEYNISSQKNGNPAQALFYTLHVKLNLFNNRTFLQHGVIKDRCEWLFKNETNFEYFVCGAKDEYEYIKKEYGYETESLLLTGLPRFDGLKNAKVKNNQILIMPTWRNWLGRETNSLVRQNDFRGTEYFKNWNGLLNDPDFISFIEENNIQVKFYPHINMQKFLINFSSRSKNIEILSTETNIQDVLKESALMITDFSSVFMDFAYLEKPIIYFQFDQKEFREKQYEEGYFSYEKNGFGPVTKHIDSLIEQVKKMYKNNRFTTDGEYLSRMHTFFNRDNESCSEKIYTKLEQNTKHEKRRENAKKITESLLVFLSFIAFFANALTIYYYYTITPMMIMGLIILLYRIMYKVHAKKKFLKFELAYLAFLLGLIVSAVFSYDRYQSVKILVKLAAIIFSILQYRALYYEAGKEKLKKIFCKTSILFILVTFILYAICLFVLNFNFNIDNIKLPGVMVDRKMPRLMTLAAPEPNASCQFLMIPLIFFLCFLHKTKTKREKLLYTLGIISYMAAIALTLSRGGIVTLFCTLVIFVIFNGQKLKTKIKTLGMAFLSIVILATALTPILNINTPNNNESFIATIVERFMKSDGGSGRTRLWEHAIDAFKTHPLIGIGPNSSVTYGDNNYGHGRIIHNIYLEILSETGIFTTIIFLIFVIMILAKAFAIRKQDNAYSLTILAALFVSCLFLSKQYWEIFYVHILIVDLCVAFTKKSSTAQLKTNTKRIAK